MWRDECYFLIAEQSLSSQGPGAYATAVDFCLLAESFRAQCLGHTTEWLNLEPISSHNPSPQRVEHLAGVADRIAEYWEPRDPRFGEYAVQRLWSHVCTRSYAEAPFVTGDLLDMLPSEAEPFVVASAARALTARTSRRATFAERIEALDKALDARGVGDETTEVQAAVRLLDLWQADAPGDVDVPAVIYAETSRRVHSEDSSADRRIAILEAVARTVPPELHVVREAAQDEDPLVRWTSQRLMQ